MMTYPSTTSTLQPPHRQTNRAGAQNFALAQGCSDSCATWGKASDGEQEHGQNGLANRKDVSAKPKTLPQGLIS